jgi:molybdopterin-binding protein
MGEAARALGVSVDTQRRWDRIGRLQTTRDTANYRRIPVSEIHRLLLESEVRKAGDDLSALLRVKGVVKSVTAHGIKALVAFEAGPFEITTTATLERVHQLQLKPGSKIAATIRATAVMIEPADS